MSNRTKSDREIRLTAALYVMLGVLEHVRATEHLPEKEAMEAHTSRCACSSRSAVPTLL